MKKTILIGIAGGSASGKTSISAQLKEHYEDTNSDRKSTRLNSSHKQ